MKSSVLCPTVQTVARNQVDPNCVYLVKMAEHITICSATYWKSKVYVHASRSFNTLLMSLDLNLPDTLQYSIYKLQTTVGFITLLISKNVRERSQTKLSNLATQLMITKLQQGFTLLFDTDTHTVSHLHVLVQASKWKSDWR